MSLLPVLILTLAAQETTPPAAKEEGYLAEGGRMIHEWRGESAGDQFGWVARDVGDADGDGVHDAAVTATTHASGGPNAGRLYLYSGKTGELLFQRDGEPGSFLGSGVGGAGDVDGDGHADVIAGAPAGGQRPGKAFVWSGADGELLLELTVGEPGDDFGRKVEGVGDLDGDGHDDVVVGAPKADAGGPDRGRVSIHSGATGEELYGFEGERDGDLFGSVVAGDRRHGSRLLVIGAPGAGEARRGRAYVVLLEDEPDVLFVIEPEQSGANLGRMFASVLGDVDGDGTADVYVSDWEDGAKGPRTGRVYVHSGADGERLFTLGGEAAGDGFGIGPGDAGDVDGDGRADLVIGAWQHGSGATSGGRVYLYSGADQRLLRTWTCTSPGETFGFDATGLGDVDGDGALDFLVTGAWSPLGGAQRGRAYVLAGERAEDR